MLRPVLCALVLVASGCGREQASTSVDVPPPADNILPCFPETGSQAFIVAGVPVAEATVERFAAFYKSLGALDADRAKARAIDEAILATAAVYASYYDRLEEWTRRVRAIEARLKAGEAFADVAKAASDCVITRDRGGDLGNAFRRDQNFPALTEVAFRLDIEKGEVSQPIVTPYGAHFLKALTHIAGSSPERDQRTAAHILVAFDPQAVADPGRISAYRDRANRLKKEAHADAIRAPYKKLIPAGNRK